MFLTFWHTHIALNDVIHSNVLCEDEQVAFLCIFVGPVAEKDFLFVICLLVVEAPSIPNAIPIAKTWSSCCVLNQSWIEMCITRRCRRRRRCC